MDPELEFIAEYNRVFLGVLVLICILTILYYSHFRKSIISIYDGIGWMLVIGSSLYIGSRDLNIGIDTRQYYSHFYYLENHSLSEWSDFLFYLLMCLCSRIVSWNFYLTLIALIYIGGPYFAMKKLFGKKAIFSLLIFIISPYFFQSSINIMRNGFAASLFVTSLAFYYRPKIMYFIMGSSCLCHSSMIICFILFYFFKNSKTIKWNLIAWFISIILQLSGHSIGSIFRYFLTSDVATHYIDLQNNAENPWGAFLSYGMMPIIIAIYCIYKKHFKDPLYYRLLNTFLIVQALYIQVINIPFAMRFAYLSLFLMPILLLYPFLKKQYWNFQYISIAFGLLLVFWIKAKDLIY